MVKHDRCSFSKRQIRLESQSDEELLSMYRDGHNEARDVLSLRYIRISRKLVKVVCSELPQALDPFEIEEACFFAYLKTEKNFDFDKNVKFLSLMCINLRNEIFNLVKKTRAQNDGFFVDSYDENSTWVEDDFGEGPTECYEFASNESTDYVDLVYALSALSENSKLINQRADVFALMLANGFSVGEASEYIGLSFSQGRSLWEAIKKAMAQFLEETSNPKRFEDSKDLEDLEEIIEQTKQKPKKQKGSKRGKKGKGKK